MNQRNLKTAFCFAMLFIAGRISHAQVLADTLFSWEGYLRPGVCYLTINKSSDEKRPHLVELTELAENKGPSTAEDLSFLADQIARSYQFDPVSAFWIVRWGAYSHFADKPSGDKEILLRATFTRTETGRLATPQWRVISRGELKKLRGK